MGTINTTTAFDVGDNVWLKSALDSITMITPTADNKFWINMNIPFVLFKVTQIKVRVNSDNSYTKLYAIQLFLPESQTSSVLTNSTGVSISTYYTDIEESSLYEFSAGMTKINAKLADFESYLSTLSES